MSVYIIAEAGVNHNGDMDRAFKMIEVAAAAGADAIKFQAWKAERLASRFAGKADYQKETTEQNESQLEMLRTFELNDDQEYTLKKKCNDIGIEFLCSPFDMESIDLLAKMGLKSIKVPSGELTNLPYLEKLGRLGKHIILSTGMGLIEEIKEALEILEKNGTPKDQITVLHCNTEYPTPFEDVNLRAMKTISENLGVKVGYSDHTPGIEVSVAATALGAQIIEKHFTLDKSLPGPDHKASLDPDSLHELVNAVRNVEKAMGSVEKIRTNSEAKNLDIARKSIVAKTDIQAGETFDLDNLTIKRPGNGISPMQWYNVLGTKAVRDFKEDEMIEV